MTIELNIYGEYHCTPHIAAHIFRALLKKKGSLVKGTEKILALLLPESIEDIEDMAGAPVGTERILAGAIEIDDFFVDFFQGKLVLGYIPSPDKKIGASIITSAFAATKKEFLFHPDDEIEIRLKSVVRANKKKAKGTTCPFCQNTVREPTVFDKTYACSCGAAYWTEVPENLYLAADDATEYFGLESPEQVEVEIIRNFDLLDGKEEVCLVSAKPC